MGIRNLNKYLKKNCTKSIRNVHLKELEHKSIVIDTSIYLYRFITEDALMENMYHMISILLSYNIEPIFVFDGKPPIEKNETINNRKNERKLAYVKYEELERQLGNNINEIEKKNIQKDMNKIKRQIVSIKKKDIYNVKELLSNYGIKYINSDGEADELCAYLVNNDICWGCLSDDTDMFVYGCKYVLREINLLNHTVYVYDTNSILSELNIPESDFKDILILSSSEYNYNINIQLMDIITIYQKYRYEKVNVTYNFYIWLLKNTSYIKDYKALLNTYQLYTEKNYNMTNIIINDSKKDIQKVQNIMSKEGFVFI